MIVSDKVMSIMRLYVSRVMRNGDLYLPKKCNAPQYMNQLYKGDVCDCKVFCKYPQKGSPIYISLKAENDKRQKVEYEGY